MYKPTAQNRALVKKMAICGIPQEDMASVLGIDVDTLKKYFSKELQDGKTLASTEVIGQLYYNATKKNNVIAQIFWAKTRCRWSEKTPIDNEKTTKFEFIRSETRLSKRKNNNDESDSNCG